MVRGSICSPELVWTNLRLVSATKNRKESQPRNVINHSPPPIFLGLTFDRGRFRDFDLHPIPPRLIAGEQLGRTMPEFV